MRVLRAAAVASRPCTALALALALTGDAVAQSRPAAPVASTATALARIVAAAPIAGARIGIIVTDASSGAVLFALDADAALNPASNAKVITAAAALALLGADHRYATTLRGRLSHDGATVESPLVFQGGGDPSLSSADLLAMAHALRRAGVRRVAHGITVDDGAFGAQHLPPAFEQQPNESAPFRAPVSAASVDGNTMTLRVRPGATAGAPALVELDPPGYAVLEPAVTTSEGRAPALRFDVTTAADGREHAHVTGTFPRDGHEAAYTRRVENPSLAAGYALEAALEAVGVRVVGTVAISGAPDALPELASHASAPLSSLLYELGKASNNFYAEMTLLAIAAQGAATPAEVTFARGATRELDWLRAAGVATAGLTIRNGSGLFDANRVSPHQLAAVLQRVWHDPAIRDEYIAQLSVGGDDGTLHTRLRIPGAERWVRAKTGTLDDVIALSGYVLAPSTERTLVFSFIANGVRGHQSEARALADQIVGELVAEQLAASVAR